MRSSEGGRGRLDRAHHQAGRGGAAGSAWAIGTELNLVPRLAKGEPGQAHVCLDPVICLCSTMYRIHLAHFVWAMEELVEASVVNRIQVDAQTAAPWARVALERMLALPGKSHRD